MEVRRAQGIDQSDVIRGREVSGSEPRQEQPQPGALVRDRARQRFVRVAGGHVIVGVPRGERPHAIPQENGRTQQVPRRSE